MSLRQHLFEKSLQFLGFTAVIFTCYACKFTVFTAVKTSVKVCIMQMTRTQFIKLFRP
jgi:hypothetical protein